MAKHMPAAPAAWRWAAFTAFVLVLFYWTPLLAPDATIQWNALHLHYPAQHYFSEQVRAGHLPHWVNYVFAGFPMLSDPQTGGFYPLNWPFFAAGVTPLGIQMEIVLHAVLAIWGAFLLLRRLTARTAAALAGALSYGLGGYFASHSSHVGMIQAAALLPWLLYCWERAGAGNRLVWLARAAAVAGACFLTGSLGSAVVALLFLILFAVWRRMDLVGLAMVVLASLAVSTVVWLPALTFWQYVRPAGFLEALAPRALATLFWPDALGLITGAYRGGADPTRSYLYSGLLLVPLAAFALRRQDLRGAALLLTGVPLILTLVHSADHWFAAALGLSILVTYGIAELEIHWRREWVPLLVLAVFALDLCASNSWLNPLAYARMSYQEISGDGEKAMQSLDGTFSRGLRLEVPDGFALFGSLNSSILAHVESTAGYNPLQLAAWRDYRTAAPANRKLVDGLSAAMIVSPAHEQILPNGTYLPRAYFAPHVAGVASLDESRRLLPSLDPAAHALVQVPFSGVLQDPAARVLAISVVEQGLRVRYRAVSPSLLKVATPFYPGWQARADGESLEVLRVDHALMGAVVPAGEHEVVFAFETKHFAAAAAVSALAALGLLLAGLRRQPG